MYLMRRDPSFEALQRDMNRLFDNLLEGGPNSRGTRTWAPPVEIYDTGEQLTVLVELPGFEKDQVNVSFENGQLSLSGERRVEEQEGRNYHRNERWYGKFERTFQLPAAYDFNKIKAQMRDGILTVTLPKKEEAKPRQIAVSVS